MTAERSASLIQALRHTEIYTGLTQALNEVAQFHPPEVIDALLHGTLERKGEVAVHLAAMLFFLHGKASSTFDTTHHSFFLRFATPDSAARELAFRDLCEAIGTNPKKYLTPENSG